MKAKRRPRNLSLLFILFLIPSIGFTQVDQISKFMAGGVNDAEQLFEAYISPYANAIGADLSAGWYNTAKVHKPGGFDITVTANVAIIPESDQSFNLDDLDLTGIYTESIAPTAAGETNAGPTITYYQENPLTGEDVAIASFNTPKGSGLRYTPAPMLQASLGLFKGTEVMGRFTPELELGDAGTFSLWGVGLKHDVKQWIPGLKKFPVLHISVMGGYTSMSSSTGLSMLPEFYNDFASYIEPYNANIYSGQEMAMNFTSYTGSILVSANLPVVCFYGGLGFSTSKAELNLNGLYPIASVEDEVSDPNFGQVVVKEEDALEDPFNMEIKNTDGSTTNPRINVGARLKFAVITLHFDYTYANYSVATAGLGITFR